MIRPHKSQEIIQELLEVLQDEIECMSDRVLRRLQEQLFEMISMLRSAVNIRRPFLSLPVEILIEVFNELLEGTRGDADWSLSQFWNAPFLDSAVLVPATQTCRRLRNILVSQPHWWQHITTSNSAAVPSLVTRSGQEPVDVIVKDPREDTSALQIFYPSISPRMRGLHFLQIDYARMKSFKPFLELVHPELEALTCCGVNPSDVVWQRRRVVLSQDRFPRLRQLVMEGAMFRVVSPLPSLTHLVLSHITLPGLHTRIALLLASCPNLESLVLSKVFGSDATGEHMQPVLSRLRRITLHDLVSGSMRLYLSLTSLCGQETAFQMINEASNHGDFEYEPLLSECMRESPITFLGIGICPTQNYDPGNQSISVTVASPVSALRIASTNHLIGMSNRYRTRGNWVNGILSQRPLLAGVHELWLVRISCNSVFGEVSSVIGDLPSLQTVVFLSVNDDSGHRGREPLRPPTLANLPNIDNPTFSATNLKTLRIVQCFSPAHPSSRDYDSGEDREDGENRECGESKPLCRMDFSQMLLELESSAYCYLENLVIQLMPRAFVDEDDVQKLREYFTKVTVEDIEEPPRMPLPQCCTEDDEGPGGGHTWAHTLC